MQVGDAHVSITTKYVVPDTGVKDKFSFEAELSEEATTVAVHKLGQASNTQIAE